MADPIIINANTPAVIQIKTGPLSANLTSAVQEVNNQTGSVTINWANLPGAPVLATVATSGLYSDLTGVPNLAVYLTTSVATATYQPLGNYANASHTHAISDVTGLQTALDGKQASGSYVLTSDSRLSDARTPLAHTQAFSTITGTPTTLSGYGITDGYSTSNPSGYITASALSPYLTTASASSTYLSIAAAQQGYQPIGSYATTGENTFSGTQSLAGNFIDKPTLRSSRDAKATPPISAGTLTLDLNTSNFFAVSLNAAITTFTISNVPTSVVASFVLEFTADGTARAVAWPASFRFPSGTTPTLTTTSGKKDVFVVYTSDDGTTFDIVIAGQNL